MHSPLLLKISSPFNLYAKIALQLFSDIPLLSSSLAQAKNVPRTFLLPKQLIQRFIETFANRYA